MSAALCRACSMVAPAAGECADEGGAARLGHEPLALDLADVDEPTAAHVIEAILHSGPRIAANVDSLRRKRSRPGL